MIVSPLVQQEKSSPNMTIKRSLEERLQQESYNRIDVAMAYATIAGVRVLLDAFSGREPIESQWLLGLDDFITQPGAIHLLMGLENAQVRVAVSTKGPPRFHPKVCRFRSFGKELVMIGSANLTRNAMSGNSEAVVFLEGQSPAEKRLFSQIWEDLWSQGHEPTEEELAGYETGYEKSKKYKVQLHAKLAQKERHPRGRPILDSDGAEIDPSQARTCWVECGCVTAMGRELEFKAEQGLFFGLDPSGGKGRFFRFRTSKGSIVSLRMKYQQNRMWRLQMNNAVPEVERGLRPTGSDGRLGRSDKVAVFTRTDDADLFDLGFVDLGSRRYAKLKMESRRSGTIGRTTARSYGWC